jgi:hypothetical protein
VKSGTFIPTVAQHQLLRAALLADVADVRASLDAWKSHVDIEAIDAGSMRLLPLLYRNLTRLGIDDPLLPRLKGVYRQVWFRNQLILEHGVRALRTLSAAGIPSLVLKGAALVSTAYAEPALRPMEDFDLLVAREQFPRAVHVLLADGWSFHPPLPDPEPHFVFQHAIGFRRDGGGELDLHWSATGLPFDLDDTHTQPLRIGGEETRMLAPADQLLQICAHATLLNPHIPPIRWAADAFLLLAQHGVRGPQPPPWYAIAPHEHTKAVAAATALHAVCAFPWRELVEIARVRGWSLAMRRCLEYLRDGLDVEVPDDVIATFARQQRFRERIALALRNGRGRMAYAQFFVEWMQHAFIDVPGRMRRLMMLPRFLRSYARVDTTAGLLRLVTSRLALNTRRD